MTMYESSAYPVWPVHEQTLVFDVNHNRQVCAFDERVVLPVGATIELYDEDKNAHGTATVVGVRMLNGNAKIKNQICLDVEADKRWWDAHPVRGL
ncbi:hypothetical protein FQ142_07960 [Microbacterium sp. ANT_H45B]|uniref:hypothetical protein n=1 Tax=Microbacterium sp. ANT_H45B TaxID=2597346 RepID=UPI0011EF9BC4|nr:hypothetical protein [Microbacterium sp. ANT_H45B]KAA0960808.1 hypothetical protein FQ142_07960 [Microbacterium sp. ANT_H45B]